MTRQPTVYDVASRAGVSIATVSRVLRRPDEVRPETRERVMSVVRALGYVPSASARGLAGRRTGVLGLLLPPHEPDVEPPAAAPSTSPSDEVGASPRTSVIDDRAGVRRGMVTVDSFYYDEVVRGAEREASAEGFALLISAGVHGRSEEVIDEIAGRVDGLIVMAATLSDEVLAKVARRGPVVTVADSRGPMGYDRVTVANSDGMEAVAREVLRDPGVRTIAYLGGPEDSPDERDRRRGFDLAVERRRATGPSLEVTVLRGDFNEPRGIELTEQLFAASGMDGMPDAIVCANDQSALGVLQALTHAGVPVPGRVRVTGFDGVAAGRHSTPRLTTVRQPMDELGRAAVRRLLSRLEQPTLEPALIELPVEVLLRESSPPAR